jgi:hypothetical protein
LDPGHALDEPFEFSPFRDPLRNLGAQLAGDMEGAGLPFLLPREQGRLMDRTFAGATAARVAAPGAGDGEAGRQKGAQTSQAFQDSPARRVGGQQLCPLHSLKYTYFRNKSQQKSACAKKELRPLTQPQLVQQLLREKKPFFTAAYLGP